MRPAGAVARGETELIVNADDLGKNAEVNAAVAALAEAGLVTSATILANAPAFEQAVAVMSKLRRCSIGVHLNNTEFAPLTRSAALRPMLDSRGCFRDPFSIALPSPALLDALYREWSAQIRRVCRAGIRPTHLDSHNHVHARPVLYPVIRRLQREFGIDKVRRGKNLYAPVGAYTRGVLVWRRLCHAALLAGTASVTTAGFTDLPAFCRLWERLGACPSVEIMVHPGHPGYRSDEAVLRSDHWRGIAAHFRLINYRQLGAAPIAAELDERPACPAISNPR